MQEDSGAAQVLGVAPACSGSLGNDELVKRMAAASGWISRRGAVCGVAM